MNLSRQPQDDDARKVKTQLLADAYDHYLDAIVVTPPLSSSQGETKERVAHDSMIASDLGSVNKSDETMVLKECADLHSEVIRTAFNLHKQGLMMPWIFQCLYKVIAPHSAEWLLLKMSPLEL